MTRFSRHFAAAILLSFGAISPAVCQTAPAITVLELFTSQGCSSCPAADALFKSYLERPDLMALSYSVDYWDYLGWKDTLANPKFSERQRGYGKSLNNGQIYTPQMVINGTRHVVGSSRSDIDASVKASQGTAASQAIRVEANRSDSVISVRGVDPLASPAAMPVNGVVWLVIVHGTQTVAVKRGENSGRTLSYFNVVRDVAQVGEWTGKSMTFRIPSGSRALGQDERYAVLIQREGPGPLLGAGWVR
jgi:hypothetical protein